MGEIVDQVDEVVDLNAPVITTSMLRGSRGAIRSTEEREAVLKLIHDHKINTSLWVCACGETFRKISEGAVVVDYERMETHLIEIAYESGWAAAKGRLQLLEDPQEFI